MGGIYRSTLTPSSEDAYGIILHMKNYMPNPSQYGPARSHIIGARL